MVVDALLSQHYNSQESHTDLYICVLHVVGEHAVQVCMGFLHEVMENEPFEKTKGPVLFVFLEK